MEWKRSENFTGSLRSPGLFSPSRPLIITCCENFCRSGETFSTFWTENLHLRRQNLEKKHHFVKRDKNFAGSLRSPRLALLGSGLVHGLPFHGKILHFSFFHGGGGRHFELCPGAALLLGTALIVRDWFSCSCLFRYILGTVQSMIIKSVSFWIIHRSKVYLSNDIQLIALNTKNLAFVERRKKFFFQAV